MEQTTSKNDRFWNKIITIEIILIIVMIMFLTEVRPLIDEETGKQIGISFIYGG